jgi:hypothetical protein
MKKKKLRKIIRQLERKNAILEGRVVFLDAPIVCGDTTIKVDGELFKFVNQEEKFLVVTRGGVPL